MTMEILLLELLDQIKNSEVWRMADFPYSLDLKYR